MKNFRQICFAFSTSLCLMMLVGCGGPATTDKPTDTPPTKKKPVVKTSKFDLSTPDGAYRHHLQITQDSDPVAMWNQFPKSYQKDINGVVQEFAKKVDPELWNRGSGILQKLVTILKAKKDLIVTDTNLEKIPPMVKVNKEEVGTAYDSIVQSLGKLTSSDLADTEKMKSFDGGKFLSSTLVPAFTSLEPTIKTVKEKAAAQGVTSPNLDDVKVTVISQEGDTALLKVETPQPVFSAMMGSPKDAPKEKPSEKKVEYDVEEVKLIKIEGKWLPEKWKKHIAETKENLNKTFPITKERKEGILKVMAEADRFLKGAEEAETEEDLTMHAYSIVPLAMMISAQTKGILHGKEDSSKGKGGMNGPSGPPPGFNSPKTNGKKVETEKEEK